MSSTSGDASIAQSTAGPLGFSPENRRFSFSFVVGGFCATVSDSVGSEPSTNFAIITLRLGMR